MSIENPYQSPQSASENLDEDQSGGPQRPTWRFIVLTLICVPTVVGPFAVFLSNFDRGITLSSLVAAVSITLLLVPIYVGACVSSVVYWKAPSRKRLMRSGSAGAGLVQGAIWALAILAIPSAFVSTCYPVGLATANAAYPSGAGVIMAILLGIVVGIVCVVLTGRLAYNLWLDALGRPRKSGEAPDDPQTD